MYYGSIRVKIKTTQVRSGQLAIGGDANLLLIAGPCVIETAELLYAAAEGLLSATDGLPVTVVFKASYDKANRSSPESYRGPGLERGLELLACVRERFKLPITSDVHSIEEAVRAREVLDVIQIPAFLCRQNDLLHAAAESGRIVNVKKGQFLSPGEMPNRIRAARGPEGVSRAIATERGTFFGYNNLVNDFKAVTQIRAAGIPTLFDATHSVQLPGGRGATSGGAREYAPALARAAAAAGIDGFFFEVHPDPDKALCDGPNCMYLGTFRELLAKLIAIDALVR
jgi:2-dehydro-3-deoxyphosphooctonate aldolase (KDO 8-P synthase)